MKNSKKNTLYLLLIIVSLLFNYISSDVSGRLQTIVGNGLYDNNNDQNYKLAINTSLLSPSNIVVDNNFNLYITDTNNHKIRFLDYLTKNISVISGNGFKRADGRGDYSGDNRQALEAGLNFPRAAILDETQTNLYFSDSKNYRIRKINFNTGIITTWLGTGSKTQNNVPLEDGLFANSTTSNNIYCLKFDSTYEYLYFADTDNNLIRRVDMNDDKVYTYVGRKNSRPSGFLGDGGPATLAIIASPRSIALDKDGNLYISDYNNHRIRKVDKITNIITTIVGSAYSFQEIPHFNGDDGPPLLAKLNLPEDIILILNNMNTTNIIFADTMNHRIRQIAYENDVNGIITTIAGISTTGYEADADGSSGLAINSELNTPTNLAIDTFGNIFVTDKNNDRIRLICNQNVKYSCNYCSSDMNKCICDKSYEQTGTNFSPVCTPCIGGTYSLSGDTSCSLCTAGKYSLLLADTCITCQEGKYSVIGSSVCNICYAGTYSKAEAGSCISCTPGFYSPIDESNQCTTCEAGKSVDTMEATTCDYCEEGLSSRSNSIKCCEQGYVSNSLGYCDKCTYPYTTGYESQNQCDQVDLDLSPTFIALFINGMLIIYGVLVFLAIWICDMNLISFLIHTLFPFFNLFTDIYYLLTTRFASRSLFNSCATFILFGPLIWFFSLFTIDCYPLIKKRAIEFFEFVTGYLVFYDHISLGDWDHIFKFLFDVFVPILFNIYYLIACIVAFCIIGLYIGFVSLLYASLCIYLSSLFIFRMHSMTLEDKILRREIEHYELIYETVFQSIPQILLQTINNNKLRIDWEISWSGIAYLSFLFSFYSILRTCIHYYYHMGVMKVFSLEEIPSTTDDWGRYAFITKKKNKIAINDDNTTIVTFEDTTILPEEEEVEEISMFKIFKEEEVVIIPDYDKEDYMPESFLTITTDRGFPKPDPKSSLIW
jgi:sugar lactone lactonase YvrE